MTSHFLIIRHGETEFNATRVIQTPDVPLSAVGKAQARRLAEHLEGLSPTLVLTSDYQRALDTTSQIVKLTGVTVRKSPLLRERNFGDWRGTPYAELDFDPFDPDRIPPGGESWDDFNARVESAFDYICNVARSLEGRLVVVTHGLVCKALTNNHFNSGKNLIDEPWENTSVTEVMGPPWEFLRINCTDHLVESSSDKGGIA